MSAATPWKLKRSHEGWDIDDGAGLPVTADAGMRLQEAEVIVRAVNAHDALVEALKAAFTALHEGEALHEDGCPEDDTCACPLRTSLQAALDLAGGKP